MLQRLGDWVRQHPRAFDGAVASFWLLVSLATDVIWPSDGYRPGLIGPAVVMAIALYWRRRHPIRVFTLIGSIVIALTIIDVDGDVPITLLVGVYSLAAWAVDRRRGLHAFAVFAFVGLGVTTITDSQYLDDAVVVVLVLAISWVTGDAVRHRRKLRNSLVERAERAEALRDSMAQQAVAEERTRIARELHDVVAHSMSLMVVQAGAARRIASIDPARTVELIESVEQVGRNSLDEMRRILGVLRGDDHTGQTVPQPDLDALGALCDEFDRAGLSVTVTERGDRGKVPASLELTAYRIVQESLTNTLKHAKCNAATVTLDWHPGELEIVVENDGAPGAIDKHDPVADAQDSGAHKGIVGMRERVAAFGGDFRADPRLGGGWRVQARLPFEPLESATVSTNQESAP